MALKEKGGQEQEHRKCDQYRDSKRRAYQKEMPRNFAEGTCSLGWFLEIQINIWERIFLGGDDHVLVFRGIGSDMINTK